jgi:hypothetical protein
VLLFFGQLTTYEIKVNWKMMEAEAVVVFFGGGAVFSYKENHKIIFFS